jgi:osmotically-inducible protein OsmY
MSLSLPVRRLACLALPLAVAATILPACTPLVLGGAAVTGALVATDRRSSGAQLDDQTIELRAASSIRETAGSRVRVNVTSYNRKALITGEAASERDRQLVEEAVRKTANVAAVFNEVSIANSPGLREQASDSLTTGRVKAALIDAKDVPASAIKVVTERGTVFLMGLVSQREADRATEVTRTTQGVQKVVRVFEVLSDQEITRLQSGTSTNASPATVQPSQ